MTLRDLLDYWPAVADLATDMRVPVNTAKQWRSRGRLPAKYWDALLKCAKRRGYPVTAESLVAATKRAA